MNYQNGRSGPMSGQPTYMASPPAPSPRPPSSSNGAPFPQDCGPPFRGHSYPTTYNSLDYAPPTDFPAPPNVAVGQPGHGQALTLNQLLLQGNSPSSQSPRCSGSMNPMNQPAGYRYDHYGYMQKSGPLMHTAEENSTNTGTSGLVTNRSSSPCKESTFPSGAGGGPSSGGNSSGNSANVTNSNSIPSLPMDNLSRNSRANTPAQNALMDSFSEVRSPNSVVKSDPSTTSAPTQSGGTSTSNAFSSQASGSLAPERIDANSNELSPGPRGGPGMAVNYPGSRPPCYPPGSIGSMYPQASNELQHPGLPSHQHNQPPIMSGQAMYGNYGPRGCYPQSPGPHHQVSQGMRMSGGYPPPPGGYSMMPPPPPPPPGHGGSMNYVSGPPPHSAYPPPLGSMDGPPQGSFHNSQGMLPQSSQQQKVMASGLIGAENPGGGNFPPGQGRPSIYASQGNAYAMSEVNMGFSSRPPSGYPMSNGIAGQRMPSQRGGGPGQPQEVSQQPPTSSASGRSPMLGGYPPQVPPPHIPSSFGPQLSEGTQIEPASFSPLGISASSGPQTVTRSESRDGNTSIRGPEPSPGQPSCDLLSPGGAGNGTGPPQQQLPQQSPRSSSYGAHLRQDTGSMPPMPNIKGGNKSSSQHDCLAPVSTPASQSLGQAPPCISANPSEIFMKDERGSMSEQQYMHVYRNRMPPQSRSIGSPMSRLTPPPMPPQQQQQHPMGYGSSSGGYPYPVHQQQQIGGPQGMMGMPPQQQQHFPHPAGGTSAGGSNYPTHPYPGDMMHSGYPPHPYHSHQQQPPPPPPPSLMSHRMMSTGGPGYPGSMLHPHHQPQQQHSHQPHGMMSGALPAQASPQASHNINSQSGSCFSRLLEMGGEPDRRAWLEHYMFFMEEIGKPLTGLPQVVKQPLDLYRFYLAVRERGGVLEVIKSKRWKEISQIVNINASASAAYTLRKNYCKYLLDYECRFDRAGLDTRLILAQIESMSGKKKKPSMGSSGSVNNASASNNTEFTNESSTSTSGGTSSTPFPPPSPVGSHSSASSSMLPSGGTGTGGGESNGASGHHPNYAPPSITPTSGGQQTTPAQPAPSETPSDMSPKSVGGLPSKSPGVVGVGVSSPLSLGCSVGANMLPTAVTSPYAPSSPRVQTEREVVPPPFTYPQSSSTASSYPSRDGLPGYLMGAASGWRPTRPPFPASMNSVAPYPGHLQRMPMLPYGELNRRPDQNTGSPYREPAVDRIQFSQQQLSQSSVTRTGTDCSEVPRPGSAGGVYPPESVMTPKTPVDLPPTSQSPGNTVHHHGTYPSTPYMMHPSGPGVPPYPHHSHPHQHPSMYPLQKPPPPVSLSSGGPSFVNHHHPPQQHTGTAGGYPSNWPGSVQSPPTCGPPSFTAHYPPQTGVPRPPPPASAVPPSSVGQQVMPPRHHSFHPSTGLHGYPTPTSMPPGGQPNQRPMGMPQHHSGQVTGMPMLQRPGYVNSFRKRFDAPLFPPGCVEATTVEPTRRKRFRLKDIGSVNSSKMIMALRSGLPSETTWALNALNIMLREDSTNAFESCFSSLDQLTALLTTIADHWRHSLNEIFPYAYLAAGLELPSNLFHSTISPGSSSGECPPLCPISKYPPDHVPQLFTDLFEPSLLLQTLPEKRRKTVVNENKCNSKALDNCDIEDEENVDEDTIRGRFSDLNGLLNLEQELLTLASAKGISVTSLRHAIRRVLLRGRLSKVIRGRNGLLMAHESMKPAVTSVSGGQSRFFYDVCGFERRRRGRPCQQQLAAIFPEPGETDVKLTIQRAAVSLKSQSTLPVALASNLTGPDACTNLQRLALFAMDELVDEEHHSPSTTTRFNESIESIDLVPPILIPVENCVGSALSSPIVSPDVTLQSTSSLCMRELFIRGGADTTCYILPSFSDCEPVSLFALNSFPSKLSNAVPISSRIGLGKPANEGALGNAVSDGPGTKRVRSASSSSLPCPILSPQNNIVTPECATSPTTLANDEDLHQPVAIAKTFTAKDEEEDDELHSHRLMTDSRGYCPLRARSECIRPGEPVLWPIGLTEVTAETQALRCLGVTTVLRNLSFLPAVEHCLCSHKAVLALIGRVLSIFHVHVDVNADWAYVESETAARFGPSSAWWMPWMEEVCENVLVLLVNIAGRLQCIDMHESIVRPLLLGLLHWTTCQTAAAVDPLPGHRVISPCRLALEAMNRLAVNESNVDMLLATPSVAEFELLNKLFDRLSGWLAIPEDQVTRELALSTMHYLCESGLGAVSSADSNCSSSSSSTFGLCMLAKAKPCPAAGLAAFIEAAEAKTRRAIDQYGVEALQKQPELMGTTLEMVRRAGRLLERLASNSVGRTRFTPELELRLLSLATSRVLDAEVAKLLSGALFNLPHPCASGLEPVRLMPESPSPTQVAALLRSAEIQKPSEKETSAEVKSDTDEKNDANKVQVMDVELSSNEERNLPSASLSSKELISSEHHDINQMSDIETNTSDPSGKPVKSDTGTEFSSLSKNPSEFDHTSTPRPPSSLKADCSAATSDERLAVA